MKNIILFIFFGTLCASEMQAKVCNDTLVVKPSKDISIEFPLDDVSDIKNITNLDSIIDAIHKDISQLNLEELNSNYPIFISINKNEIQNQGINITPGKPESILYKYDSNGSLIKKPEKNKIYYIDGDHEFTIMIDKIENLSQLEQDNMDEKLIYISNKIEEAGGYNRHSRMQEYDYSENKEHPLMTENSYKDYDQLNLAASTGVNLVRNTLAPDFSVSAGITLNKKGVLKHNYFVNTQFLYLFDEKPDGGYKSNINTFLILGYRYNLAQMKEENKWIGIDLGYLVNKSGDYFNDNTYRIGLIWDIGSYNALNISITPQIYFNDFFEDAFPGVKLGVGF